MYVEILPCYLNVRLSGIADNSCRAVEGVGLRSFTFYDCAVENHRGCRCRFLPNLQVLIGDLVRSAHGNFDRRPLYATHFYMPQINAVLQKAAIHGVLFVAFNFL